METNKNPWKILDSKHIYENPWLSLTEYQVINPAGNPGIYGKVHFKNRAIGIVALDEADNIYLVGQYRFSIDQYTWELPEGGGLFDETPLDTAKRELQEETGLKAENWEELLIIHPSNSVTDEIGYVFLATGLSQHETNFDDTEDLRTRKIPFDIVLEEVMTGKITDSLTMAAILKLQVMRSQEKS
ncbi:MAG: DNA mismatch repair protein MutT [Pseudopedobacter saltans]|uniref:GDP-mannose pyrophosphatase n=1 Tax=Pseudopedobacter saltans TaxID=151895 RepID=A0A2W5EX07_9SPHI|nr:MAG: DNA mismatch repair protein MutT [Pseudopedobacter saltans]